jgi:hypothetical protein
VRRTSLILCQAERRVISAHRSNALLILGMNADEFGRRL